jgi:hypothetical protein
MPNINIPLNDDEFKTLQNLKKDKNLKWKDLLLNNIEKDITLDEINEHYTRLKSLIPNLHESLEYMRAATIRFHKLSSDAQKIKSEEINKIAIEYFNKVMNSIKETENE